MSHVRRRTGLSHALAPCVAPAPLAAALAMLAAPFAAALLAAALLAGAARGQAPTVLVPGDQAGDAMGRAVAGVGDVNGDGVPDFAVGAPQDGTVAARGYVRVRSGAD